MAQCGRCGPLMHWSRRTNALQEWAHGARAPWSGWPLSSLLPGARRLRARHVGGAARRAAAPNAIGVNSYLWRATLDTLAFMPLASADPYGGVVITDWYANPEKPDERFKCTVYILDTRLRGDALKVTVFKEVRNGAGGWVDLAGGRPDLDRHRERHPDPGPPAQAFQPQAADPAHSLRAGAGSGKSVPCATPFSGMILARLGLSRPRA